MAGAKPESQKRNREDLASAYREMTAAFARQNGFNCTMEVAAALGSGTDDRSMFIIANYIEAVASQIANACNGGKDIGTLQMAMSALAESGFCPPVTIPNVDIHLAASSVADMTLQEQIAKRSGAGGATARSISQIAADNGVALEPGAAAVLAVYAEAVAQELMDSAGKKPDYTPDVDDINAAVEECTYMGFFST